MLRLLKGLPLAALCAGIAAAVAGDPSPADIDQARQQSREAIEHAEQLNQAAPSPQRLTPDQGYPSTGDDVRIGIAPLPALPAPDPAQLAKMQRDLRTLLAHPEAPTLAQAGKGPSDPPPLIFVSFSIPDDDLRALLREAAKTGSPVVLRGMVDNSMKRTVERLGALLGKDTASSSEPSPSLAIDPTLFERFKIDHVPAFVLPASTADPCTPSGCPTPDHLKLAGDVSLSYALGVMAREAQGTTLGDRADEWKHTLEASP